MKNIIIENDKIKNLSNIHKSLILNILEENGIGPILENFNSIKFIEKEE